MPSDTDADTRRILPGYGATRLPGRVRRGLLRTVVTGVVVLVVAVLALLGVRSLTSWPFGDKEIDRSGPAVLTAMRDLSEYHAAAGQYQVVIDIEQDAKYLPDIIKGKRTIFLAIGSVDAYVDFRKLGDDAVSISDDRRTVSLTLPRAQLSKPNVDPDQSRVLNQDLGVIDRLGGLFSDQPNPQNQQMYVLAQQRLSDAATQVGLQKRAEDNTKATLDKLMRSLGFTTVNIKFVDSAAGG
jgi:type II secretory pathway pseudopilin PulG